MRACVQLLSASACPGGRLRPPAAPTLSPRTLRSVAALAAARYTRRRRPPRGRGRGRGWGTGRAAKALPLLLPLPVARPPLKRTVPTQTCTRRRANAAAAMRAPRGLCVLPALGRPGASFPPRASLHAGHRPQRPRRTPTSTRHTPAAYATRRSRRARSRAPVTHQRQRGALAPMQLPCPPAPRPARGRSAHGGSPRVSRHATACGVT